MLPGPAPNMIEAQCCCLMEPHDHPHIAESDVAIYGDRRVVQGIGPSSDDRVAAGFSSVLVTTTSIAGSYSSRLVQAPWRRTGLPGPG